MRCAVHTEREAVGVCSCGRGVCEQCADRSAAKLVCNACVASPAEPVATTSPKPAQSNVTHSTPAASHTSGSRSPQPPDYHSPVEAPPSRGPRLVMCGLMFLGLAGGFFYMDHEEQERDRRLRIADPLIQVHGSRPNPMPLIAAFGGVGGFMILCGFVSLANPAASGSTRTPKPKTNAIGGFFVMLLLSLLLFWMPLLGPLIAGIVGGRVAGTVGAALGAATFPAIIGGLIVHFTAAMITTMPDLAFVTGLGTTTLLLIQLIPLIAGAIIGGIFAPKQPAY